jgi:carbon monoxide dehydrogenase subunit G
MPIIQRFLAPLLLLILALPLAMMAMASGLGLQPDSLWNLAGLPLLLVIPGLALVIRGLSLSPKPGQPFDARRFERQGSSILLGGACLISSIALLAAALMSPGVGLLIVGVAALWVLLWTPPWLRRLQIETSAQIQRDPAAVFSFVADARNLRLYMPTVLSVEKLTQGPIGPGTQFQSKIQLGPATTTETIAQIVEYEPNSRITSRALSGAAPNLDVTTFTAADSGTLIRARFESEVSFSLALAGAAFRIPQAKRQMMAAQQECWLSLKQILENSTDPAKT